MSNIGCDCPRCKASPWTADVDAFNAAFDKEKSEKVLAAADELLSKVAQELLPDGPGEERRQLSTDAKRMIESTQQALGVERARLIAVGNTLYGDQPGGTMAGPVRALAAVVTSQRALVEASGYSAGNGSLMALNVELGIAKNMLGEAFNQLRPQPEPDIDAMLGLMLGGVGGHG